jgi:hypothetical protein
LEAAGASSRELDLYTAATTGNVIFVARPTNGKSHR